MKFTRKELMKMKKKELENITSKTVKKGKKLSLKKDMIESILATQQDKPKNVKNKRESSKMDKPKREKDYRKKRDKYEPTKNKKNIRKNYKKNTLISIKGCLQIMDEGYGFLRNNGDNYTQGQNDVYISQSQIRRFKLKNGHIVSGLARQPKDSERFNALIRVEKINEKDPDLIREILPFEKLIPYFPEEKFNIEEDQANIASRIISLFTPIGKGQRGLIVAAPRTGKTVLLQNLANSILSHHKEVYLFVLLIDERPEEVTDMEIGLFPERSEVVYSTFDEVAAHHVQVAEMVIEKAKRMVEFGQDVVIMLDSITRLARAYNNFLPSTGKTLSGGVDVAALHYPKKFFGAARNIRGAGSLTILATALVDTGSRMDQVIFEEFKGTGNMELVLDRSISNVRVYPAIDFVKSGTRKEELLLDESVVNRMIVLRRYLKDVPSLEALEMLMKNLKATKNNKEFLENMSK